MFLPVSFWVELDALRASCGCRYVNAKVYVPPRPTEAVDYKHWMRKEWNEISTRWSLPVIMKELKLVASKFAEQPFAPLAS
jgi:hypothetical protein